jgi:hypothetical protein
MPVRNSLPKCHALGTCPYRIRSILHVRAVNILAIFREYRGPDAELGVRAVCRRFGGRAPGVQSVELGCGYGEVFAGLEDMGFVIRLEESCRHVDRKV